EAIDWARVDLPPPMGARSLELEMRDGRPIWRVQDRDGQLFSVPAGRGAVERPVDAAFASRVASRFGGAEASAVEQIERDQWTVGNGFDRHRPLWKVSLADGAGTQLYISSSTGGVAQSTTRTERFWNWLGSVPHWLYPTVLRQNGEAWRQVVLWVSGPCIAAAVTGIWIGLLRTRMGARRFKGGRMTPYHGWMLWHHVAGLVGGVTLFLWIFSGWLSVDPGRLFTPPDPPEGAEQRYAAGTGLPAIDLAGLGAVAQGARLARFTTHAGLPRVTLLDAQGERRVLTLPALTDAAQSRPAIEQAATVLVPTGRIAQSALLTAPDAYWYEVGARPQLPVLRLRFDDPARTWLYLDPLTGEMLQRVDARRRTYRWLYDMFHKWDLNALTLNRPLWDMLLWIFSLIGLITSVSGVWIGWKRLRH
ncbi:MAG: hypothetical protein J0G94_10910, partial [Sphingomonadales bacterium]|nr:hypothetical protein [Sphingomonadales bacterium]